MPQATPLLPSTPPKDNEALCSRGSRLLRSCTKTGPDSSSNWALPTAGYSPCKGWERQSYQGLNQTTLCHHDHMGRPPGQKCKRYLAITQEVPWLIPLVNYRAFTTLL